MTWHLVFSGILITQYFWFYLFIGKLNCLLFVWTVVCCCWWCIFVYSFKVCFYCDILFNSSISFVQTPYYMCGLLLTFYGLARVLAELQNTTKMIAHLKPIRYTWTKSNGDISWLTRFHIILTIHRTVPLIDTWALGGYMLSTMEDDGVSFHL